MVIDDTIGVMRDDGVFYDGKGMNEASSESLWYAIGFPLSSFAIN